MKIILTGATGFLGSNLLRGLIENNVKVVVLKRSFSDDKRIHKYLSYYRPYDIDTIKLSSVFEQESEIDAIIHCATNYGRDNNVNEILRSNVVYPLQLLELATSFGIKTFINTDTFFGKTEAANGYMHNYTLSKNQFNEWGKLYAVTEKINFINMRLEHIYGEGDNDNKFVPFIINNLLNNVDKIDLTDGEHLRDFVYIDDVVAAYLCVLSAQEHLLGYNEYEVGFGNSTKVHDFVCSIKEVVNSNSILNFGAISYRENEILYSKANIAKLQKLGWIPQYDIIKGIRAYIDMLRN